jgi:hypothetical protein
MLSEDESERVLQIVPTGAVYETVYDYACAWVQLGVGICGYTGRKSQQRPTAPRADLSNLLASRTVQKGKGRVQNQNE